MTGSTLRTAARSLGLTLVLALASGIATDAFAAGFYGSQSGVRPLGRGGAFVAGADDLGAISYNPAGIYDAGTSFLIDASWVNFNASYTRQALLRQVDPNTGETVATYQQTFPEVSGTTPFLPIPTIAGSFSPHRNWVVAFGAHAPYTAIPTYPDTVGNNVPAPQRYSLLSLNGSLLVILGGYVAWAPVKNLRIGLGVEALVGTFASTLNMSSCIPERFFCSPEDPSWDVLAQIKAAPIITPSGNVGVIWEFVKGVRLGGSFHLPFWIRAPATVKTRLPTTPVFDRAAQEGEDATIAFTLPFTARLGIELHDLVKNFRIELAGDYEQWSMDDSISVEPGNIALTNLPGFPKEYFIPNVKIPQNAQNTIAAQLGAEYTIRASDKVDVIPRLGVSYETSAIPSDYLSVLLMDSNKVTASVGGSVRWGNARIDLVYAHTFAENVTVSVKDAKITQTLPLQANPPKNPDYINAGSYSWNSNVVGLGLTYTFSHPVRTDAAPEVKTEIPPPPTTNEPSPKSVEEPKPAVDTTTGASSKPASSVKPAPYGAKK